jgi:hypothetical protein
MDYLKSKTNYCYKTISRVETAIAVPCAEYVNQYETRCIRDVGTGLNYTNNLLTPAEAIKRIQDIKGHINFMRWGPWRPALSDWAIMDLYELEIERLKKDLKELEVEFDLVTNLTENGIQGTFELKPKK